MTISKREIQETWFRRAQDLCALAERLGYRGRLEQLQNSNGSFVSNLTAFFDDNPGAIEAVVTWVLETGRTRDGSEIPDELPEDADEE